MKASDPNAVFAFEVSVAGTDWTCLVNERTPGRAKKTYWYQVVDAWPDVPFTAMRCRKLGPPQNTREFKRTAEYRGLPHVNCGDRVQVGQAGGVIVGKNSSANFDVLFDVDAPEYRGLRLNVHPAEILFETPRSTR